jgi:alpha-galactosidase
MAPLVGDIAEAGFVPGLWIAPFMVGNRSRLFQEHPDWVVRERATGEPLAHMKFYGEFRWHKRSEEYYPLDITHPGAEAYIRRVFRTWRSWGVGYFKTDFMLFGSEYGPDRAVWHEPGLSRIAIWRRMAELVREEIGDALWLGCGCPLWASVGLVDAMRIGRDIGVSWRGNYSAESLLRDQVTRNHASGILWQADPDCILLRDRFHELSDEQVRSLAVFAGLAGGVLMTSDKLDELPPDRAELFAALLREPRLACGFPEMERHHLDGVIVQRAGRPDGSSLLNLFNTRDTPARRGSVELAPYASRLLAERGDPLAFDREPSPS